MRRPLTATLALVFVLSCCAGFAVPAYAGSLGGVSLPDTVAVEGDRLVLNGMALRKKFFIKVYVAGLYLPTQQTDASKVLASDTPRRTVLHFLYGVDKEQICEAWTEGLANNTPNPSAALERDFETLCGWMEDVDKGERLVFTYVPGEGTTVEVQGEVRGTIDGKAFADALFASWIGPNPGPGEDFREDLMGG